MSPILRLVLWYWLYLPGPPSFTSHTLTICGVNYSVKASAESKKKGEQYKLTILDATGKEYKKLDVGLIADSTTRDKFRAMLVKRLKGDLFPACPASAAANDDQLDLLVDVLLNEQFNSHSETKGTGTIDANNVLKLQWETGNGFYYISNYHYRIGPPDAILIYNNAVRVTRYEFQWAYLSGSTLIKDHFDVLYGVYSKMPSDAVAPKLLLHAVTGGYEIVYSYDGYVATAPAPAEQVLLRKEVAAKLMGGVNPTITLGAAGPGGLIDIALPKPTKNKAKDDPAYIE